MASNFSEKYRSFMNRRSGPDQLSNASLMASIITLAISLLVGNGPWRTVFLLIGIAFMVLTYWRMFSTKIADRARENAAYIAKRDALLAKVKAPFAKIGSSGKGAQARSKVESFARQAQKAASQAKAQASDKDHKYYACPSCGQTVRVPKGAGKIRVTCPKCGTKFEKKA